jgi:hypothetical protein
MAGLAAVLIAVARAQWRDLRTLQSIAGNNFFLFVLLLMQDPKSAALFALLIGALILFPLAADPLRLIPPDRLALWPFSRAQFVLLRLASLGLSPVVWIIAVIAARSARLRPVLELAAVFAVMEALLVVTKLLARRLPRWNVLRAVPPIPGTLGEMIRKDIRQIVSTLDFYIACLLAALGIGYRLFSSHPDAAAIPVLTLVVVLAMSTWAQCLFGLDGPGGLTRYQLMPLPGWRILLAKDLAWLAVLLPLVIALDPLAGFTGGFAALAVGHHASVRRPIPQQRQRFTSGSLFPAGLIQVTAMFASGTAVGRLSLWFLPGALAACAASMFFYGYLWDRGAGS